MQLLENNQGINQQEVVQTHEGVMAAWSAVMEEDKEGRTATGTGIDRSMVARAVHKGGFITAQWF